MLDPYIRPLIDLPLGLIAKKIITYNISPNSITLVGFIMGIISMILISITQYNLAILFFCLNRLCDGLDGAVARQTSLSDFGGFIDIVCDFIIYSGIVFAFGIANKDLLFYSSFLVFSFIGPITSFLAYAIIASKRKINTELRGKKSFYYLGGICEGTETATVLILLCLFPQYFNIISIIFGILCWITTIGRVYNASVDFS
jgi:phosphatidylglycerophosphate synthase